MVFYAIYYYGVFSAGYSYNCLVLYLYFLSNLTYSTADSGAGRSADCNHSGASLDGNVMT